MAPQHRALRYRLPSLDAVASGCVDKIENIQRRAARLIARDYKSRHEGAVTEMLENLELPFLQERRRQLRPTLLYKISNGLVPALPENQFISKINNKRQIKPRTFTDHVTSNTPNRQARINNICYQAQHSKSLQRQNTIVDWNNLEQSAISRLVEPHSFVQ